MVNQLESHVGFLTFIFHDRVIAWANYSTEKYFLKIIGIGFVIWYPKGIETGQPIRFE